MAQYILSAFADEACNSLTGQIDALRRNHIGFIEPRSIDGPILDKSEDELSEIRRTFDANGIRVSSLGSPIGKYPIDQPFDEHYCLFSHALRACEILGTDRMRIFSFFVTQDKKAEYRDEVMRRMNAMLDEADRHGITLCHENESAIYGQNPDEVGDLLASLPRLHGVFDAANYIMNDQSAELGLNKTMLRFSYMHVKDAVYTGHKIVAAGEGDTDYPRVLDHVGRAVDGTVYLTVEPHLFEFDAYKLIDKRAFPSGKNFSKSDAAFDYAVSKLKEVLISLGYHEEGYVWKK